MGRVFLAVLTLTTTILLTSCQSNQGNHNHHHGSSPNQVKWHTDWQTAKEIAQRENKVILADFSGSDWCGWCIRLDREVFHHPAFQNFARKNLVLLLVDFPKRKRQSQRQKSQNHALAHNYKVEGFPTVLLLDAQGNVLHRTGYRKGGAQAYVEHLKANLK